MAGSFTETLTHQTLNLDLSRVSDTSRRPIDSLCTDIFLIVIRMREAEDLGDPASLVKLIRYYLELFEKNCAHMGIHSDDVSTVKYAMVALLDETVLSIPGACRDYWISSPLQLDYFGDNLAGEEFFRKLDKLLVEPAVKKEIIEVYYLCLALGFEGKFRIAEPSQRERIVENIGRVLKNAQTVRFQKLSPHGAQSETRTQTTHKRPAMIPLWVVAASAAALTGTVWLICVLLSMTRMKMLISLVR